MQVASPIVKLINPDVKSELDDFYDALKSNPKEDELIKDYPTVYIHNWEDRD